MTRYFGEDNIANYKNNEAFEILKDIYNISDEKTFKEKYEKLQNMYEEERPYIGLCFSKNTIIYTKSLSIPTNCSWFNMFYSIENWSKRN